MDNNPNNRDNGGPKKSGPSAPLIILIISIVLTLVFWQQYNAYKTSGEEEVSYDKFIISSKMVGSIVEIRSLFIVKSRKCLLCSAVFTNTDSCARLKF